MKFCKRSAEFIRKGWLFTFLLSISALSLNAQTAVSTYGDLSVSGSQIVDKNGDPVQLQGMSLFWSQWEPEFYDYTAVQKLRDDWCTNIVRAAMAVEQHDGDGAGYLAQPGTEKAKVKTVVDAAIDLGMYVIIDWHDHNAHNHQEEAVQFFSEMAQEYGDNPNVIYEIFNEPLGVSWSNDVKPYCEAVISAIREHDPDNLIICGTPTWSQDVDAAADDPISGTNIAYTLHYYAGTHGQELRNKAEYAMNNGIALFVTEFGTVNADGGGNVDQGASNEWFSFLDQHNLSYCNWSLCDKDEGSAALQPGTGVNDDWSNNLTTAGNFIKNRFTSNCPEYEETEDCNGDLGGTASIDDCGECTGGNTGIEPNSTCEPDCNGDYGGTAFLDECDRCVGGETGLESCNQQPYNGTPHVIPGQIEAEEFDTGGPDVAYNDTNEGNNGAPFRSNTQVEVEAGSGTDNYNIGYTEAGEWLEYTVQAENSGDYEVEFRIASGEGNGSWHLEVDGETLVPQMDATNTTDWQVYETFTSETFSLDAGEHVIRFVFDEGGINLDYMNFVQVSTEDCAGVEGGTASIDDCGECTGGTTGIEPNSTCEQDCNGEWGGTASIDDCGECTGGGTGIEPNSTCEQDCNEEWGGTASIDDCGECTGGNTGVEPNSTCEEDCNGDFGGTAFLDECDNCVGGNTGEESCTQEPFNGVPHIIPGKIEAEEFDTGGPDVAYEDSNAEGSGDFRSNTEVEFEAVPDDEGNYSIAYMEPGEWFEYTVEVENDGYYEAEFSISSGQGAGIWHLVLDGDTILSSVSAENTGAWTSYTVMIADTISMSSGEYQLRFAVEEGAFNFDYMNFTKVTLEDCAGVVDGTASIDDCGECTGGTTGIEPNSSCEQDCNGDWGGTASIDDCGECTGGETGLEPNSTCEQDCNGEWDGTASIDDCGECTGGSTGIDPNSACEQDCNGDWGGTAFYDDCENCVEGNTGEESCSQVPYNNEPHPVPGVIEAERYDYGGAEEAYSDSDEGNNGGYLRDDSVDLDIVNEEDENYAIGWTQNGEWIEYTIVVEESGLYQVDFRASAGEGNGTWSLQLDGQEIMTSVTAPNTADWNTYSTVQSDRVDLEAGEYQLRLDIEEGGFNLDYMEFVLVTVTGTNSAATSEGIKLFPNPVTDRLNISNLNNKEWQLFNSLGVMIKSGTEKEIDMNDLQSGAYYIRINGETRQVIKY